MPIDEALSPFPVRAESSFRGALPAAELAGRVRGEGVGDPPPKPAPDRARVPGLSSFCTFSSFAFGVA